jgi:hypothetical protein
MACNYATQLMRVAPTSLASHKPSFILRSMARASLVCRDMFDYRCQMSCQMELSRDCSRTIFMFNSRV